MCQVREEDFIKVVKKEPFQNGNRTCNKCEEPAIILIGTNGRFCRDCFIGYFTHKFRAALGKHGNVRYGDKVAIAYSGGPNSSALLHVLLKELSPDNPKKLKFKPGIIFVNESSILQTNISEDVQKVREIMSSSGLPFHEVNINEALNEGNQDINQLFSSLSSLTAKEEMLHKLRCRLIANRSHDFGYKHVFFGETTTRLAINILVNVSQGKGAHIAKDTAFCDDQRFTAINILRPIRDISSKEIAVYNAINKVNVVVFPTFSTRVSANASIRKLTEEFVLGLSRNFPATETTVYRTANKIKCNLVNSSSCTLCGGMLDTSANMLPTTARDALRFTEQLSNGELGSSLDPTQLNVHNPVLEDSMNLLTNTLCHSCSILQKEFNKTNENLEIFSTVFKRPQQSHLLPPNGMEEKLKDCLLTD